MSKEEATERLRAFITPARIAASMAQIQNPGGKLELGILATSADGSGSVSARFEMDTFLDDLAAVVGDPVKEELAKETQES
jgi:hypothetical protein